MRKKSTSEDVANLAGVSRATVSYILNNVPNFHVSEETRERVLEAAHQLNYHPNAAARALVIKQTHTLGLVLYETIDRLSVDPFLPAFVTGISSVISKAGFNLLLEAFGAIPQPDAYMRLVKESHIDGLILIGPRSDDYQLSQLDAAKFPTVLIGRPPSSGLAYVDVDNVAAARQAVEHLIALGHQRIACITSGPVEFTASADRLSGYQSALLAHGHSFDPDLVRYGDHWKAGYEAMLSLLALPQRPSAVFVASDVVALGVLRAARTTGIQIPHDLALVSFDDIPCAEFTVPTLTTVHVPAHNLGATAARMLLDIIRTGEGSEPVLLETSLIVRESCGAPIRSS